MRKLLVATALAAIVASGAALPARAETIPIIVKDTTSSFWQTVMAGARKAGKDLGVEVPELGATSESDIAAQIGILENAVATSPDAIVIAPTQFSALGGPITAASDSVKIVGIDSAADTTVFSSFLTTDNTQGGRVAADGLAAAIEKQFGAPEGKVALINSLPGVGSLSQRDNGFKEQLQAKYPKLELIAERVADGQATTGLNMMTDLITANPDLRGVFTDNLIMGQGAGQAIAENGAQDRIKVISFDSDERLVSLLEQGVIAGLVVQDPYRMGYDGIATALKVAKGEEVPANIDTGVTLITKDNMNEPRAQQLLKPNLN